MYVLVDIGVSLYMSLLNTWINSNNKYIMNYLNPITTRACCVCMKLSLRISFHLSFMLVVVVLCKWTPLLRCIHCIPSSHFTIHPTSAQCFIGGPSSWRPLRVPHNTKRCRCLCLKNYLQSDLPRIRNNKIHNKWCIASYMYNPTTNTMHTNSDELWKCELMEIWEH